MTFMSVEGFDERTQEFVDRVIAGETFTITENGVPIADIVPRDMSTWDRLIAEGKITPAKTHGPLDFEPMVSNVSSAEMVDDIRRDHA